MFRTIKSCHIKLQEPANENEIVADYRSMSDYHGSMALAIHNPECERYMQK